MGNANFVSRLTDYHRRHGFGATIRRAVLGLKRGLFSKGMIVFYCDLDKQTSPPVATASPLKIERLWNEEGLSQQDLQEMASFWNPKQARRNIKERFATGASLWLVRFGDRLAGYGWTLQGRSIEPYYFPLTADDVHLFDFHVFPEYRGRGFNPHLVDHILRRLAADGWTRAFIEAAEWNHAQLISLANTPFHRLGRAKKLKFFRRTVVFWE